jgi:hypothetical protein
MIFEPGDTVDLVYYTHESSAGGYSSNKIVNGKIQEFDAQGVYILDRYGDLRWFPFTSVQQVILKVTPQDQ